MTGVGPQLDEQQQRSRIQHQLLHDDDTHNHPLLGTSSLLPSQLRPLNGHGTASDTLARRSAFLTVHPPTINMHRTNQPVAVQAPPGTISLVEALRRHLGIASHPEHEATPFNPLYRRYELEEALLARQRGALLPTEICAPVRYPIPTPPSRHTLNQQEHSASTAFHSIGEGSRSRATTSSRETQGAPPKERTKRPRVDASVVGDRKTKKRKPKYKTPLKSPTRPIELTHRPPIDLAIDSDETTLSPYQSLLRKQIQLFETTQEHVDAKAQGRNVPIVAGQIGIQCKHCANLPPNKRFSGSVFYSQTLAGLYQIAQNMCKSHLLTRCPSFPEESRERLARLQTNLNRGSGGKEYWHRAASKLGVYEDDNVLKFTKEVPFF